MENFELLIKKLNLFRRKYYYFKFLRGLIISLVLSISIYIIISVVEYFTFLPTFARTFIFYSFVLYTLYLVIQRFFIPILILLNIFKQISHKNLSTIIVKFFPEIKDKLLNIIELSKINGNLYSNDIIWASIDQKIKELKLFEIEKAISFKELRFVFFYLFVNLIIVIAIIILDRPIFAESNYRIINYKNSFYKPAPYNFILQNKKLSVKKGEEFSVEVECKGDNLPQVVYINIEGNNFLMRKNDKNVFVYRMESVINNIEFYFTDLKYSSENYSLITMPQPSISEFEVKIITPDYTRIKSELLKNVGDLKIPEGTNVKWIFKCYDTDSLFIVFGNKNKMLAQKTKNTFLVENKVLSSSNYSIFIKNSNVDLSEVLSYTITVVPDLFPEIKVVQTHDSMQYSRFYFKGEIADDYGFTNLYFHLNINNHDSIFPLEIIRNLANQDFYYLFDFNLFNLRENEVVYYFSVSDNDQINGFKTTTSNSFVYKAPSTEEISKQDKEQFSQIEELMTESKQLSNEIKKEIEELHYKSLDSKITNWEKSQLVNDIVNKQNRLEQLMDQVKKQNKDLNNLLNSYGKQDIEILEKQAIVEDLLNQVFSEDLKKLLEEFTKLAEEFKGESLDKMSEKLDMSYDDLSKQLDRNLEILKKMKVEQKLRDIINKINELAEKEISLSKDIINKRTFEDVLIEDEKNKEDLGVIQDNMKNAIELNQVLKTPFNFDSFKNEFQNVLNNFKENKDNLENKNRNKSARSLKNTSDQLKSLAYNMDQLLKSNIKKQSGENIENLKQILSNLIYFSFTQEDILVQLGHLNINDPSLTYLKRAQKKLMDESVIIKDSLYSLANRTPQITNLINNELLDININLAKTVKDLDEGLISDSRSSQQFVITSINNLSLMLNEALENLEKEMANNMEGNQECENPGRGKGGKNLDMMKQSSEGLKQQLQKMIEELKKENNKGLSKMLGQSLMQHEMMQKMLRDIMNNGSIGSGAKNELQNIDKLLEQTRQELINKNISEKTLIRQNLIQTRLLEAEKSEIERDLDNTRESKTAIEIYYSNPVKYFEYNKQSKIGQENLEQGIFKLNDFYNKKYKLYLDLLDQPFERKNYK